VRFLQIFTWRIPGAAENSHIWEGATPSCVRKTVNGAIRTLISQGDPAGRRWRGSAPLCRRRMTPFVDKLCAVTRALGSSRAAETCYASARPVTGEGSLRSMGWGLWRNGIGSEKMAFMSGGGEGMGDDGDAGETLGEDFGGPIRESVTPSRSKWRGGRLASGRAIGQWELVDTSTPCLSIPREGRILPYPRPWHCQWQV
jgi:hypothetical protein